MFLLFISTAYLLIFIIFILMYATSANISSATRRANSFTPLSSLFGFLFVFSFFIFSYVGVYYPSLNILKFSGLEPSAAPFLLVFIIVTPVTLLYAFKYRTDELVYFLSYTVSILFVGFGLFFADSILVFFFLYESLLLPSFFILYTFAKTRKAVEAAFLMFFWTQFGAVFLIFVIQYVFIISSCLYFSHLQNLSVSLPESYFIFTFLLIGFGVKFPIWPFYDWLPQAHVEASTNFSIFLSGVLVKFAFFGFIKFMLTLGIDNIPFLFYPFIMSGFLDSSSKLYYQTDLKKVVAYSTVIEMHWLTLAVVNGTNLFWLSASAMLISHALLSSNFFFFVDSITRRYKTRLLSEVSGLAYQTPNLYFATLVTLVLFLGFPGTLFFIAEVFFFSALLDFNLLVFFIFFFSAYVIVPSAFFKSWFLGLFGSSRLLFNRPVSDLAKFELVVVWFFIALLGWFGFTSQSILV